MSIADIRSFAGSGYHQGSGKSEAISFTTSGLFTQVQKAHYEEASPQKYCMDIGHFCFRSAWANLTRLECCWEAV